MNDKPMTTLRVAAVLHAISFLCFLPAASPAADAVADVVVVVDTSKTMNDPGMDPERVSLLVTKLLADISPGELAVVRLFELRLHQHLVRTEETEEIEPCPDDPTESCNVVRVLDDVEAEARRQKIGALIRPRRGDSDFKKELETHLVATANVTRFHVAFRAAQGVFEEHRQSGNLPQEATRSLIWLSDGRAYEPERLRRAVADLQSERVRIEAIVFGQGDPSIAQSAGLETSRVSSPAEIMKAFAAAFRRIVQAPFRVDNRLDTRPEFDMKPHVEEAWVVVYGDDTLERATLEGLGTRVTADYAADRWPGAGAYRVAYLRRPAPGRYRVRATRGGPGVAYAVVQRSALAPELLEPNRTFAGVEVPLVAGVRAGDSGEMISDGDVLSQAKLTAEVEGATIHLADDGIGRDVVAGDGRYTGTTVFRGTGDVPVELNLRMQLVDRTIEDSVEVSGRFSFTGGALGLDFGNLRHGTDSCRELHLDAEHQGAVPFEISSLRPLPARHAVELRVPSGIVEPRGRPLSAAPTDSMELCLIVSEGARSSSSVGEPWLELRVAGSDQPDHRVLLELSWNVEGASFWDRWGRLILILMGLLILAFLVFGFVLPRRFQPGLAVAFVEERIDLDDQSPMPLRQWKGVGSGFYRDARAFLHSDYRISGTPRGAIAALQAVRGGTQVSSGRGHALYRETMDGDWEAIGEPGRRTRAGDIFRVGDSGPYFRIASRAGR